MNFEDIVIDSAILVETLLSTRIGLKPEKTASKMIYRLSDTRHGHIF